MKTRSFALALSALALATASFAASADVLFTNLGTSAPPATLGGHAMTPFNQAAQAAVPDFTNLTVIPGNPLAGNLTIGPNATKFTIPSSAGTSWAHGYVGPIFRSEGAGTATLTLPANTKAFYFYLQANAYGNTTYIATTNSGTSSGPIVAITNPFGEADGATGFAFYSTAGESISSITISGVESGSKILFAEFGINGSVVPATTCASEGYTGTKLTWCKNICENGLTGATLDIWIHRWINRYRDLPYCAAEGGGGPVPTLK